MRILVFYPYIPYPLDRGTYQRVFHLLTGLAAEHEVDLLALTEGGERVEHKGVFEAFCRKVELVPFQHPRWASLAERLLNPTPTTIEHWNLPEAAAALEKALAQESYDLIHVCDIVLARYLLDRHPHLPLSVDRSRVDLQFQLQQHATMKRGLKGKLLDYENLAKLIRFEKRVAKRCAVQVVCGPDDKTFIREHISKDVPVLVVANGVDLTYFHPGATDEARAEAPTVLFCGAMDYNPNVDALRWFFESVHDRLLALVPDLRVLIVGRSPLAEVVAYGNRTGVEVTGGVPDVRPYYRKAWMQIVPLRIGGGTRLKIVESLAIGTPVVSTTIGAQGLDLTHGKEILLADTAEAFAQETAQALKNPELLARIEQEGKATAQARFGWPALGAQLSQYYTANFSKLEKAAA